MKTITIEVPDTTPVILIAKAVALMGLRVKWRTHNQIVGIKPEPLPANVRRLPVLTDSVPPGGDAA